MENPTTVFPLVDPVHCCPYVTRSSMAIGQLPRTARSGREVGKQTKPHLRDQGESKPYLGPSLLRIRSKRKDAPFGSLRSESRWYSGQDSETTLRFPQIVQTVHERLRSIPNPISAQGHWISIDFRTISIVPRPSTGTNRFGITASPSVKPSSPEKFTGQ